MLWCTTFPFLHCFSYLFISSSDAAGSRVYLQDLLQIYDETCLTWAGPVKETLTCRKYAPLTVAAWGRHYGYSGPPFWREMKLSFPFTSAAGDCPGQTCSILGWGGGAWVEPAGGGTRCIKNTCILSQPVETSTSPNRQRSSRCLYKLTSYKCQHLFIHAMQCHQHRKEKFWQMSAATDSDIWIHITSVHVWKAAGTELDTCESSSGAFTMSRCSRGNHFCRVQHAIRSQLLRACSK